jgi:hypothetical protein
LSLYSGTCLIGKFLHEFTDQSTIILPSSQLNIN